MKAETNRQFKTLGPQASRLVAELHERSRSLFSLRDVIDITGFRPGPARSFMAKLVSRGIATRLKPGLFVLVPFEFGRVREYVGNPYVIARELAGGRNYYLSHSSAMDIHQMVTQPRLVVYVTTLHQMRPRSIYGTEFRFVRCKRRHFFGTTEHWIDKREKVIVSDLERTIIDGLKQPDYCGGVVEVAKGFWMRRQDIDPKRLVDYALRLNVGAVIRRLGFLMELWRIEVPEQIERLRRKLTDSYVLLDPGLPPDGKFQKRWRLQLNVAPDELQAVLRT
ncbi:MAG: transcriptional regulator [Candidatus Methylomirabilales bacterium]